MNSELSHQERDTMHEFIKRPTTYLDPARCIDGRQADDSEMGPQMPGGSMFTLVLHAIYSDQDIDPKFIASGIELKRQHGIKAGFHRGEHKHGFSCDCGFCDKLKEIIATAQERRDEILQIVGTVNQQSVEVVKKALDAIAKYSPDRVKVVGEDIISYAESDGAKVELVRADHKEVLCFVNFEENTTFDTKKANEQQWQGFNFDVWAAVKRGKEVFDLEPEQVIGAGLALYIATEMVLVEGKNKPRLPIAIHQ